MLDKETVFKAAEIAATHTAHKSVSDDELLSLIEKVAGKLHQLSEDGLSTIPTPAVPIEESVNEDHIVCLEDGKNVTLLARYLKSHFAMTPEEYIKKWGLPEDYPMVSPSYSRKRSEIAQASGLGKNPKPDDQK